MVNPQERGGRNSLRHGKSVSSREFHGTILEVREDGRLRANLGSRDGVWTGLTLYLWSRSANDPANLEVVATQETECVLKFSNSGEQVTPKAGDRVSSQW